jgi:hypothetical protein
MSRIKCPGQDTRYWKPGDIFNLHCGTCGKIIEFFKDDVSRNCPECGNRVQNPKITVGCAQWCEHAAECLGYDPKSSISENGGNYLQKSIIGKIFDELAVRSGKDSGVYRNAESSLEKAGIMMKGGTADPKIVLPAVMLFEADFINMKNLKSEIKSLPAAKEILKNAGFNNEEAKKICDLVLIVVKGENIDIPEFDIVNECYKLLKSATVN